jgi:hypothetical protein
MWFIGQRVTLCEMLSYDFFRVKPGKYWGEVYHQDVVYAHISDNPLIFSFTFFGEPRTPEPEVAGPGIGRYGPHSGSWQVS